MNDKRILFVGLGHIGGPILDMFLRTPGKHRFLVGGRNLDYLQQRTNLSVFSALQLGHTPDVTCAYINLENIDQTAHLISHFNPDIIFCAATLQRWSALDALPPPLAKRLYSAQLGPWLPIHLFLIYQLMQAVKQTRLPVQVINATYPDVIHPILHKVGLAPTTGIGDLANNIPALKLSLAVKLHQPVELIDVRFIAQHYVSRNMTRIGAAHDLPFHLSILVNGENRSSMLDMATIFDLLLTAFKRALGPHMTAASATVVFQGLVTENSQITHAPGPNGLPGGYPVKVTRDGVEVLLPDDITLEQAVCLNRAGMKLDGIEQIDDSGAVYFTESNMAILKETLGYECRRMPLSEVKERAQELLARYREMASTLQARP